MQIGVGYMYKISEKDENTKRIPREETQRSERLNRKYPQKWNSKTKPQSAKFQMVND
jgi:hypothetical protein